MSVASPWSVLALLCGLSASALAQKVQKELHARIDHALQEARVPLLMHLREAAQQSTRPGELALLVLAALHDEVPTATTELQAAIQKLAQARPDQTYDLALRLMVLEACPEFPDRQKLARADAKTLLDHRCDEGTFQYMRQPTNWDLSNTQYGALGLRAAAALGVSIEAGVWRRLAGEVAAQQDSYGGFGYTKFHGRGRIGTASMTAAGIAVLAICRQALGEDSAAGKQLTPAIERGWNWFAANSQTIGSVQERWCFYFHYGLERAAILCDVTTVGAGTDWYATGATMLCDAQLPGGGWRSTQDGFPGQHLAAGRGDAVPTSFAILFLRRKFQRLVTPITPHVVTLASIGRHSKPADVEACASELVRRGKAAMPELVKGMRSELEPQRRAAAKALQQIAGEAFGYDPAAPADGDANREAVRRAELWFLKNR
jgi:hypothetical protein